MHGYERQLLLARMGDARIMFTAVTRNGREHDLVMRVGPHSRVSEIAESLGAERLYIGANRLAPTDLVLSAIHSGHRVFLDFPGQEPSALPPAASDEELLPLTVSPDGAGLLANLPPRSLRLPTTYRLALPPPPAPTFSQRLTSSRRFHRQLLDSHQRRVQQVRSEAQRALSTETAWWHDEYPEPAKLFRIAAGPTIRLWERRSGHPDFLTLRVGTGQHLSHVLVHDPANGPEPVRLHLENTAVTVSITDEHGVLGIACPSSTAAELASGAPTKPGEPAMGVSRWILAQLAVLRSPEEIRVCLLTSPAAHSDWAWVRWLPHCGPPADTPAPAWIGTTRDTWTARISELLGIIDERLRGDISTPGPTIVAVFDGWSRFRSNPRASRILRTGPKAKVYSICLDTDPHSLPSECGNVIEPDVPGAFNRLNVRGPDPDAGLPDFVSAAWCEELARTLAPLQEGGTDGGRTLPSNSSLLNLLGLPQPFPQQIIHRWHSRDNGTAVAVGESDSGQFSIDLRADGPHALITGPSGSGKSELLRTIAASMAADAPPDSAAFLFIDYRGGSTFRKCMDFPHSVGHITDLDPHGAARTLAFLTAELRRRETLLYTESAKDADHYRILRESRPLLHSLPRLLIMVDELSNLDQAFPGFVTELANVVQRGRDLGVHLLLATPQDENAVSPEILSNINLRIALGADDSASNNEFSGVSDPAPALGRGRVRVGRRTPITVQFSQISDAVPQDHDSAGLTPVSWEDLGEPEQRLAPEPLAPKSESNLMSLIDATRQASESAGYLPPHRPWLPELPSAVSLHAAPNPAQTKNGKLPPIPFALEDLPAEQLHREVIIDFTSFGHLLAVGDRLSGRSQLLRTIAGSIAARISCSDVHIYGVDLGDNALIPVADLPHCGAIVAPTQSVHATRLVERLAQELARRKVLLASARVSDINEQRQRSSIEQRLPHIIVMLDRWERASGVLDGDIRSVVTDVIERIAQHGPTLGMHLIATGDLSVFHGPIGRMADDKLIFRLADRADYSAFGLRPLDVPDNVPDGRAFRPGSGAELQVALLDGSRTEAGQAATLRDVAAKATRRDASVPTAQRPFGIGTAALVNDRFETGGAQGRPVGREDVLTWMWDHHASGGPVALLGPRRAGKTWVLRELQRRLKNHGYQHVNSITIPEPSERIDTKDELARVLDLDLSDVRFPAETLLRLAERNTGSENRLTYLLDEVGRLSMYGPAAVSWLRDLGQAGAWFVYTGTEKDWQTTVRQALKAPGSSFGNDVNTRLLGPLDKQDGTIFLTGTAANLQVELSDIAASHIIELVGSWPFYLQVAGDAVVRAAQGKDTKPLHDHQALANLMVERLLDDWSHHFKGRWAEVGQAGRSALLDRPGEQPGSLAPGQREDLREVGLLMPGDRWLTDRPFFDWIARNATALRDGEQQP